MSKSGLAGPWMVSSLKKKRCDVKVDSGAHDSSQSFAGTVDGEGPEAATPLHCAFFKPSKTRPRCS